VESEIVGGVFVPATVIVRAAEVAVAPLLSVTTAVME
jgi:hypothetical protein